MNSELLSLYELKEQVPCGKCRSILPTVKVWQVVFLDEGITETSEDLLRINVITCPRCHHTAEISSGILVVINQNSGRVVVHRKINFVEEEAYEVTLDYLKNYKGRLSAEELDSLKERIIIAVDNKEFLELLTCNVAIFDNILRQNRFYRQSCRLPIAERLKRIIEELEAGYGIVLRECDAEPYLLHTAQSLAEESADKQSASEQTWQALLKLLENFFQNTRRSYEHKSLSISGDYIFQEETARASDDGEWSFVEVSEEEYRLLESREEARRSNKVPQEIQIQEALGEYYLRHGLPRHTISIGEQLSFIVDPPEVLSQRARAYKLMGRGLRAWGKNEEAFYHFNHGLKISDENGGELFLVIGLQRQMCQILEEQGQYDMALAMYRNQLQLLRKNVSPRKIRGRYFYLSGDPSSDYRTCLMDISSVHLILGQASEAASYLKEALALAKEDNLDAVPEIQINLCAALLNLDNRLEWNNAVSLLTEVAEAIASDRLQMHVFNLLASAQCMLGNINQAMHWLERYLSRLAELDTAKIQPEHYLNIARILEFAIDSGEQQVTVIENSPEMGKVVQYMEICCNHLSEALDIRTIRANSALAFAYERFGELEKAYLTYRNLWPIYEGVRRTLLNESARRRLQVTMSTAMARAVRCCTRLYETGNTSSDWISQAFEFAEASRTRYLLDVVAQDISATQAIPGFYRGGKEIKFFSNSAQLIDADSVRLMIEPGEVILEYALVQNIDAYQGSWICFRVGPQRIEPKLHRFELEATWQLVQRLKELYHSCLASNFKDAASSTEWHSVLQALSEMLMPPSLLPEGTKRIVVSPESYLFDLPWNAIVIARHFQSSAMQPRSLSVPVLSVVPSSNVLVALRRRALTVMREVHLIEAISGAEVFRKEPFMACSHLLRDILQQSADGNHCKYLETVGAASTPAAFGKVAGEAGLLVFFGHGLVDEQTMCLFCVDENRPARMDIEHVANVPFKQGCVVILLACWSQSHNTESQFYAREITGIGETLIRSGASAVVGFIEPVEVTCATEIGARIAKHFLAGETIDQAVH